MKRQQFWRINKIWGKETNHIHPNALWKASKTVLQNKNNSLDVYLDGLFTQVIVVCDHFIHIYISRNYQKVYKAGRIIISRYSMKMLLT